MDYCPLDLSRVCNQERSILEGIAPVAVGRQVFHGIPFRVGSDGRGRKRLIGVGDGLRMRALFIPVRDRARHILFAHALLPVDEARGASIGRVCAEYEFRYENGESVVVAVRERFEIGVVPAVFGCPPLLACPDSKDGLMPRYRGEWSVAGVRQTEVVPGCPRSFYLWSWKNPQPAQRIEKIVVRPAGPRMAIGAITLSRIPESPFKPGARSAVKIVLPRKSDARKPFGLEVEVDRGVATYPYPLPRRSSEKFLADCFKGWGESPNTESSPSYVEIAANPSATVTVKQNGRKLGSVKWGKLQEKRKVRAGRRLHLISVDPGRNWVRTAVLDDETGRPIPCRIHFRSWEGIPCQPHGHHNQVNSNLGTFNFDVGGDLRLGQVTYAYIDGKCQGWLPRGNVIVDIARGYEYEPLRARVTIRPGQQELTFRLKRFCHLDRERYFSGDTHVHFLSTRGAHLEAAGEGLHVVNLLLSQWGHYFSSMEEFTGCPSVGADGQTIIYASQENRQHVLGHLSLLGLKETVMPWCTDGPSEAELGGSLETTLSRWADACHAQGGTVILPHVSYPFYEPAALVATGRADAIEWHMHDRSGHEEYYRYLNCGYRLPIVGGTDKMTSGVPVGLYRTYVHIPADEPLTYESWCRNLRAGNTFHSGGPLLRFRAEGRPIGSTLHLPGNGGRVEVEASARCVLPIHCLEIVMNGKVVARTEVAKGTRSLHLKERIKVERHSWVAARCAGPRYTAIPHHDDRLRRGIMAHTSPIYLAVGGDWWMFDRDTANYLLTIFQGGIEYIRRRSSRQSTDRIVHHHGRDDHPEYLEEPFRQAIEALHRRMHACGVPH